ncbi:hypothetical protein EGJ55_23810 [Pseudomonas moraviensis]|nr:hypothetical protein EGJ55_23810 [Pseudomonas moraviensis]
MRIFCFIDLEVGIDTQTCATSVGVNFRTIGKRFGFEHIRLCITQTVAIVFIQLVVQLDTAHHTMGKKVELFDLAPAALPSCDEIHKTGYRVHLSVLGPVLIFDNVLQSRQQVLRIVIFENQKYTLDREVWSAGWLLCELADTLIDKAHLVALLATNLFIKGHVRRTHNRYVILCQRTFHLGRCMLIACSSLILFGGCHLPPPLVI